MMPADAAAGRGGDGRRASGAGSITTRTLAATPLAVAGEAALAVLSRGGLVALPTETVYGLCANAADEAAVAALYRAKGRPAHNPLIVHVEGRAAAARLAVFPDAAAQLAERFWPGPLTMVLPQRAGNGLPPSVSAGGATVALRAPVAPVLSFVVDRLGPLVAPSANRSGRVSATTAEAVRTELAGRIDLLIDGGPSPLGVESTVVDLTGPPTLLRPGALPRDEIEAVIGPLGSAEASAAPRSPGLLASHYAPRARLRLNVDAEDVREGEGFLAFGVDPSPVSTVAFQLSVAGDLAEAARNLYRGLRAIDSHGVETIAVSPIPAHGLGEALTDRLRRAAAPRDDRPDVQTQDLPSP